MPENTYRQDIFTAAIDPAASPGLFVKCVGDFRSLGDFYFEQIATHFSFHMITAGSGTFDADGRKYIAKPGDLFIFQPGMHVRYYDEPLKPWRYIWFVIEGRDLEWAFTSSGVEKVRPFISSLPGDFQRFCRMLLSEFRKEKPDCIYPAAAAWECLGILAKHLNAPSPGSRRTDLAARCKAIIDSQKESFIGVDELAAKLKVDRATLFRNFRKTYGVSPKDYIDTIRIEKACRLLKHSSNPIKEIAWLSGFSSHDYFSAVFKKKSGTSPSIWRQAEHSSA